MSTACIRANPQRGPDDGAITACNWGIASRSWGSVCLLSYPEASSLHRGELLQLHCRREKREKRKRDGETNFAGYLHPLPGRIQ